MESKWRQNVYEYGINIWPLTLAAQRLGEVGMVTNVLLQGLPLTCVVFVYHPSLGIWGPGYYLVCLKPHFPYGYQVEPDQT